MAGEAYGQTDVLHDPNYLMSMIKNPNPRIHAEGLARLQQLSSGEGRDERAAEFTERLRAQQGEQAENANIRRLRERDLQETREARLADQEAVQKETRLQHLGNLIQNASQYGITDPAQLKAITDQFLMAHGIQPVLSKEQMAQNEVTKAENVKRQARGEPALPLVQPPHMATEQPTSGAGSAATHPAPQMTGYHWFAGTGGVSGGNDAGMNVTYDDGTTKWVPTGVPGEIPQDRAAPNLSAQQLAALDRSQLAPPGSRIARGGVNYIADAQGVLRAAGAGDPSVGALEGPGFHAAPSQRGDGFTVSSPHGGSFFAPASMVAHHPNWLGAVGPTMEAGAEGFRGQHVSNQLAPGQTAASVSGGGQSAVEPGRPVAGLPPIDISPPGTPATAPKGSVYGTDYQVPGAFRGFLRNVGIRYPPEVPWSPSDLGKPNAWTVPPSMRSATAGLPGIQPQTPVSQPQFGFTPGPFGHPMPNAASPESLAQNPPPLPPKQMVF